MEKNQAVPLRWMSPEVIRFVHNMRFSEASDVWAYGITLWEIYTLGELPYFQYNNEDVRMQILSGVSPDIPQSSPYAIKVIMTSCWKFNSSERCTFDEIVSTLDAYDNDNEIETQIELPPSNESQSEVLPRCARPRNDHYIWVHSVFNIFVFFTPSSCLEIIILSD